MPNNPGDLASDQLRRTVNPGGAAGPGRIPIPDLRQRIDADVPGFFFPIIFPETEDQKRDFAFDKYIAVQPPLSPWLLARTGDSIESASPGTAELPAGSNDWPRLESDLLANLLGGGNGEWYLPDVVLADGDDPAFGFSVTQTGVAENGGGPFNSAKLTLSLRVVMPANLARIAAQTTLRRVPDLGLLPTLIVTLTDRDGNNDPQPVTATTVTPGPADTYVATFDLRGPQVQTAYLQLTSSDDTTLNIAATYSGYQTVLVSVPDVGFPHGRTFDGYQFEVFGNGGITAGSPPEPVNPIPGDYRFFPVTASVTRTQSLKHIFDTDTYRSRFTITANGVTRPIIDADDLGHFAGPRTEYRELTSIHDISTKYPTIDRLYFGQVSGTVVAVPVAYGIQRTHAGLAARCDSIVDDSPVTITGSRFHFTFTVAPIADPVDLARLHADIQTIPEATNRAVRVILPGGLDTRNSSSFDGFPSATTVFADEREAAVSVAVDIADKSATPATTLVNLFLNELASVPPAPLFGTLAVRLDDDYPQPVHSRLVLNLHQTADGDDIEITRVMFGPTVQVANLSPLDETLHRSVTVAGQLVTVAELGEQTLAAGQSTSLPAAGDDITVAVSRDLVVAVPVPKADVLKFVAFHTETVQQVQHPLTVTAVGVNFAAAGITAIDVQFTLKALPAVPVAGVTLSPSHPTDVTHAQIPIDAVVTGLDTTVVLTLSTTAGQRTLTIGHDFIDQPILVLTPNNLG
jgi:hypothetical protein